jgi:glycosyltransferase involved in cell wall biosynthesis
MPSVLFISLMNGAAWGGSEELWYKTVLHALEKGNKVACVVYHWPAKENKMKVLSDAGAAVIYLPNKGIDTKGIIGKIQYKITKKILLKRAIAKLPVDRYGLVVFNLGAFEIIRPLWRDFYKRLNKYFLLFHNYNEHESFNQQEKEALSSWLMKSSKNLFASKKIREVLERKLDVQILNAEILLNPITFLPPENIQPYPTLKNGNYSFIMLAALEVYRKAQDKLIEVMSSRKWRERNWTLELYGEGKDKDYLSDLIEKFKTRDKIFLKGHSGNIKTVLQNAHLVLQLTHLDAMPLAVVEAMAMSRPLVVTDVGDMPEWVHTEVNGWVSKDSSADEIDKTLEKAWQQKERWEQMGKESFKIFSLKFPEKPEQILWEKIKNG